MGIVNATPDSFSGDGRIDAPEAVAHALRQLDVGADLLDIGAESTRPGHTPIDAREECDRLLPALRGLREAAPHAILSVDTYKSEVFRQARAAGADMLNSIWGLNDALLDAAVEFGVPAVVVHNKRVAEYAGDVVEEVLRWLEGQAMQAIRAGMAADHVILDPGIGFGKRPEHNLAVLKNLRRVSALGFPTLLGISRKSTIGLLTGKPVNDRVYGSAAAAALAVAAGIDIVRVHDVAAMVDVVRVADAIGRRSSA